MFRLFLRLGGAISALRAPLCTLRHSIPLDLGFEPPMKRRVGCPTKARNPGEAMNADSLAHSLEPLGLELSPLPDQGPDEFWIELAREEMARVRRRWRSALCAHTSVRTKALGRGPAARRASACGGWEEDAWWRGPVARRDTACGVSIRFGIGPLNYGP